MKLFPLPGSDDEPTRSYLDNSLLLKLIFLLVSIIVCSLVGTLLIQLLGMIQGRDLASALAELNTDSPLSLRNYIRWGHLLSQLFTFTAPALLVTWFFYRRGMWRYLQLTPAPRLTYLLYGVLMTLLSFPLAQFTYWLNRRLPLPDWMSGLEDQANESIQALLVMDTPSVLLFNLVVIALLPAIGEELIFRGLLQQQIAKRFGRPQLAIWIAALVFSLFHFQFAGFIPRFLLGALLGYLLFWTESLWVPILAHFVFNGSQILGQYLVGEELVTPDPAADLTPNWIAVMVSTLLLTGLMYGLRSMRRQGDGVMGRQGDGVTG